MNYKKNSLEMTECVNGMIRGWSMVYRTVDMKVYYTLYCDFMYSSSKVAYRSTEDSKIARAYWQYSYDRYASTGRR